MKATFDLPPDFVRAVKLRAVHEGRKLKDVAADLLKRGLADQESTAKPQPSKPRIEIQATAFPWSGAARTNRRPPMDGTWGLM